MIVGVGVDVVDVSRFRRHLLDTPKLRDRLFTEAERELNTRSLAGRFAAKEAIAKALGAPGKMSWQHCEIRETVHGKPTVHIRDSVAAVAEKLGVNHWHLSISHDGNIATAMVIAET